MTNYLSRTIFQLCHGNHLVYNTCWEDPRCDLAAMELDSADRVLVITSAGCNALEYALTGAARVDAVDMNPRQNALLELKQAAIRRLDYNAFFQLFGRGRSANWDALYRSQLRPQLTPVSQAYWDKHGKFFLGAGRRPSFYFRGSAGFFAWAINQYIDRIARIRPAIEELLAADSVEHQREIYYSRVKQAFWGPMIKWLLGRDSTLSLLGVPRVQRRQLERHYPGGIAKFIEDRLDTVFATLPLKDNYFWRVYLTGEYTPECCPTYLTRAGFATLQAGAVDRVHRHTSTILDFLNSTPQTYSHFVLLDHMDWLAEHHREILHSQWQALVDHADDGAKFLWRGAAMICDFVDPIKVEALGRRRHLGELLDYNRELAEELHAIDRVNTYGSFTIATLHKAGLNTALPAADVRTQPTQNALPSHALAHSG